jgi:DNA-binding transcriptional regulator GbsR (MarR family)
MNAKNPHGNQFIERLGRLAEGEGLPRTAGRMMALLMILGSPLGIDEIAGELKISRASVSTNGRLLESLDIASRVTRPGDRRDYLQISAEPCLSLLSLGVRRLNDMRDAVREMRTTAPSARDTNGVKQRLQRMEQFYDLAINRAESVLSAWRHERSKATRRHAGKSATPRHR